MATYRTLTPEESAFFDCWNVHTTSAINYASDGNKAGMKREIRALMNVYSFIGKKIPDGETGFIGSRLKKTQH